MTDPNQHSSAKWDGDDPRMEAIFRAASMGVSLGLYDEVLRPAEEAVGSLISEHNGLLDRLHAEQRDRNWWAANNSRERQRLEEQLETARGAATYLRQCNEKNAARAGRAESQLEALEGKYEALRVAVLADERDGTFPHQTSRAMYSTSSPAMCPCGEPGECDCGASSPASEPHKHNWSIPAEVGVYRCMTCGVEATTIPVSYQDSDRAKAKPARGEGE